MAGLRAAFAGVAYACQAAVGGTQLITITRVGGTAANEDAQLYRERSEWRSAKDGREQVFVRKAVLKPGTAAIPIGSVFVADGLTYTVDQISTTSASGAQTIRGTRTAAASVNRPGYYGTDRGYGSR